MHVLMVVKINDILCVFLWWLSFFPNVHVGPHESTDLCFVEVYVNEKWMKTLSSDIDSVLKYIKFNGEIDVVFRHYGEDIFDVVPCY